MIQSYKRQSSETSRGSKTRVVLPKTSSTVSNRNCHRVFSFALTSETQAGETQPTSQQQDSEVVLEFSETHDADVRAPQRGGTDPTRPQVGCWGGLGVPEHGKSTELLCAAQNSQQPTLTLQCCCLRTSQGDQSCCKLQSPRKPQAREPWHQ